MRDGWNGGGVGGRRWDLWICGGEEGCDGGWVDPLGRPFPSLVYIKSPLVTRCETTARQRIRSGDLLRLPPLKLDPIDVNVS